MTFMMFFGAGSRNQESFIYDFFTDKRKDFLLLLNSTTHPCEYVKEKNFDYTRYIIFTYEVKHKGTDTVVRFYIRCDKEDNDRIDIICKDYDEASVYYIGEHDDVEKNLNLFLDMLADEIVLDIDRRCEYDIRRSN